MTWLCIWFPHKWIHIFNTFTPPSINNWIGIWQCERCKRISIGRPNKPGDLKRKERGMYEI
jgi:hypothetical protein